MRNGFLTWVGALFISAGVSWAQAPSPLAPASGLPPATVPISADPELTADPYAQEPRFWIRSDFLLWWVKDGPTSFPLLTTSPPASQGIPSKPGTVVRFGGTHFDYETFSGLRLTGGMQDPSSEFGLMGGAFLLEQRAVGVNATANNAGIPLLARPIVSPTSGQLTSTTENNPVLVTTNFSAVSTTRFWGGEANLTGPEFTVGPASIRPLVGFRYLDLAEGLDIDNTVVALAGFGNLGPGATVSQTEGFHTRNQFFGGQVGAQAELRSGSFFFRFQGKLALGDSHEVVTITGSSTRTSSTGVQTPAIGALLATVTNSGRRTKDGFGIIPEVGVDLGYEIIRNVRITVGHTFLSWSDVVRPGDQIDPVVNTLFRLGVGPARPAPLFNHTDYWAQGMNFGLTLRY